MGREAGSASPGSGSRAREAKKRERDHLTSAVPARLSPLAATQDKSPPLPRTTKKNMEVGAALYGPESSSYPLAVETLKDRTVSWVSPDRSDLRYHSLTIPWQLLKL